MIRPPHKLGFVPALLAAVLAALGVFPATADSLSLKLEAGLNYQNLIVTPKVTDAAEGATLTFVVTDPCEAAPRVAKNQPIGTVQYLFENLTAAKSLAVDGYIIASDGVTTNAAVHEMFVMGDVHQDDWVHETPVTFTNGTGTGVWSGKDYACVSNGLIQVDTTEAADETAAVMCSFGSVPDLPRPSRGFILRTAATFPCPFTELPDPGDQRFGLTMGYVDDDHPERANFVYVEDGGWTAVPLSVCNPLASTNWEVYVSVDRTAATATYYVRKDTNTWWTLLGTAENVGSGSATEASVRGSGAFIGLDGNGYDAQLIQVDSQFSSETLYPGMDFEQTVITGYVKSVILHETDLTNGTFVVRLYDLEGNEIETQDYEFRADGTMEFYVETDKVKPGVAYRAEVELLPEAEANEADLIDYAIMGRVLTNDLWAVNDLWISENAKTFDGVVRGSGVWTTNDYTFTYAWTTNDWIQIQTVSEEEEYPVSATVSFDPTNVVDESVSGYVTSIRAVFTEAAIQLSTADAAFGFTVAQTDEGLAFACLSNKTWQIVPRTIAVPELGVPYQFTAYVDKEASTLQYLVADEATNQVLLMSFTLDSKLVREFTKMDVTGVGKVTDLTTRLYSTALLRVHASFDEDTLYPGTNFEASTANGYVTFDRLWLTSHTNGTLYVSVRDKFGFVVSRRRVSFHDLERCDFKYYITGLEPGEIYSVKIEAEVRGIDSDSTSVVGSMARVVTNGEWAVSNQWIREDHDTFTQAKTGTGDWTYETGQALGTNGLISINTVVSEDPTAHVNFNATNELPKHTGFEMRSTLFFDAACSELPTLEGEYGITLVDLSSGETPEYQFAVITNGVWTLIDTDVYEPETGVEYEMTVRVDYKKGETSYLIRPATVRIPTVLVNYESAGSTLTTPYQTDFYGVGRVRTHEGDGFDVSLVEISAELDAGSLTPGTNFAETAASGVLKIRQIWMTDKDHGHYTIAVRDSHGRIVSTETLSYQQLTNQNFNVSVTNLVAGEVYDVEVSVDLAGEQISSDRFEAVMARKIGGWIREDPATFLGEETGTGIWLETNTTASVVETLEGRAIRIDVCENDKPVGYNPTNDSLSVRSSTVREIRFSLNFDDIGWYASGEAPEVPSNAVAGVTIWNDDNSSTQLDTDLALAVVTTNGEWIVLDDTRALCSAEDRCNVKVLIDYLSGFVRYELETATATNTIYQYDIETDPDEKTSVAITGAGRIWSVDGDVWDPNLITTGEEEFWDLNEAIRGTSWADDILSPLWWANQTVSVEKGKFRVCDTNHWLNIVFPRWYYVVIEGDTIKVYTFNSSNNWIDYAEDGNSNIDTNGVIWIVKTAEGLSWVAAQATNRWISGRIALANDIDLTAHNWTPIAGFSGAFDGRGQTITGLNNTNRLEDIPGGEYICGPTNDWGRTVYGLFGTATNATLADVTFAGVAISNLADSVAALVGSLAGNCTVSNVTVESGSILGLGEMVAGLAGRADVDNAMTLVNNTNRADVAAENLTYGVGLAAAGIVNVAGVTDPDVLTEDLGTLVVTNNENWGTISNTVYDADLLGGNVAQILAGSTVGSRYGDVVLTDNRAHGSVEANLVRSQSYLKVHAFPIVNLAPCFWGSDEDGIFWRSFDANDSAAIPVDPVKRTARMLSDINANGSTNDAGRINDALSALSAGGTYTMTGGLDEWAPIKLDRDITFDLGGFTIFTVFINNTFEISEGVNATVQNGTIVVGAESEAFHGAEPTTSNLEILKLEEDFYERTVFMVGDEFTSVFDMPVGMLNAVGTVIQLFEGGDVTVDEAAGTIKVSGVNFATLSEAYAFSAIRDDDGEILGYRVRLANTVAAMPTMNLSFNGSTVNVSVGNTKAGMTYTLQQKTSLAAVDGWEDVEGQSVDVEEDGQAVNLSTEKTGDAGYYRIMATETASDGDDSYDE